MKLYHPLVRLWHFLYFIGPIAAYAIAPSCYQYKGSDQSEDPKDISQNIQTGLYDAINMARIAIGKIDQDQPANDRMRDLLFPGLAQHPRRDQVYRYIKDAYTRAQAGDWALQNFDPNDPSITLIFYCGNSGFQSLAPQGYSGWFWDQASGINYAVDKTQYAPAQQPTAPCRGPGDVAVTAQGPTRTSGHDLYGVILCHSMLDMNRHIKLQDAVNARTDEWMAVGDDIELLHNGILATGLLHELFHVTSFSLMLPEPMVENVGEEYQFSVCTHWAAQVGWRFAVKNIENYIYYALSRSVPWIEWDDDGHVLANHIDSDNGSDDD